jgi:hypothetical protein
VRIQCTHPAAAPGAPHEEEGRGLLRVHVPYNELTISLCRLRICAAGETLADRVCGWVGAASPREAYPFLILARSEKGRTERCRPLLRCEEAFEWPPLNRASPGQLLRKSG